MGKYCAQSTLELGFAAEAPSVGMGSGKRWPIFCPLAAVTKGSENSGGARLV